MAPRRHDDHLTVLRHAFSQIAFVMGASTASLIPVIRPTSRTENKSGLQLTAIRCYFNITFHNERH